MPFKKMSILFFVGFTMISIAGYTYAMELSGYIVDVIEKPEVMDLVDGYLADVCKCGKRKYKHTTTDGTCGGIDPNSGPLTNYEACGAEWWEWGGTITPAQCVSYCSEECASECTGPDEMCYGIEEGTNISVSFECPFGYECASIWTGNIYADCIAP